MKKFTVNSLVAAAFAIFFLSSAQVLADNIKYSDSWGKQGYNLVQSKQTGVNVIHSINEFTLDMMEINGEQMHVLSMPGVFLQNNEGAPNLPGNGNRIAIPEGSVPVLNIVSTRTEVYKNIELAPAPNIPWDDDNSPLVYAKNMEIYGQDAYYPAQPVQISEVQQIRGVDFVMLGITPFQYNPVTKELIVYRDIDVEINFLGGTGVFGEERLRSRWWDPIMQDALLNSDVLPEVDYNWMHQSGNRSGEECEYIIISPDGAEFQQWADSIRDWRTKQGILTNVVTLTEVGGNTSAAIEAYINNAYYNWGVAPAACLLLGDYGSGITNSVTSPIYNSYCVSDNMYADVTGNHMPDVVFARITANNADQLEVMVTKFIHYERNPPTNLNYYGHPITALGWQTERWFQICSESVGGFWTNELGKSVERINAIYSGSPGSVWSTAQNTSTVVNVFGPNGEGYIPATPSSLGGWTGGTGTMVNNAINSGAFMMMHRDHGSTTGWGEPSYNSSSINGLDNEDLVFVFSINCLTGKYNIAGECFAEKFHRHTKNGHNAGALGIIAASETSYSFVNDTYVWGMMDNMWTDFLGDFTTTPDSRDVLPAFGNAAGKYFLQASSWPYNTSNKQVTYHLFHHHGGAFLQVHYNLPQAMTAIHEPIIPVGSTTFSVSATPGSFIALTHNGEILSTATGGFGTTMMSLPPSLQIGEDVILTITKQNYLRYEATLEVQDVLAAGFSADATTTCVDEGINFTDETIGTPTSWLWTFEGGTPETSTEQNPSGIIFDTEGTYDVTLEVTSLYSNHTEVKEDYISSFEYAEASIIVMTENEEVCEGEEVMFTAVCENEGGGPLMTWTVNGNVVGDNNDTLFYTGLTDQYVVACELTSSRPCLLENPVTSNILTMTVSAYVEVIVNIETETLEICDGAETIFTAVPQNPGDEPTYTWMLNGNVVGDNTGTYTTTELTDQDIVTCELNSSEVCTNGNPATSNSLTMTVLESTDVSLSVGVATSEICEGDEVTFTATPVNPGDDPTYEWKVNGEVVGDNSTTYTSSALTDEDMVVCEMVSSEFCPVPNPAVSNEIVMDVTMLPVQATEPQGPDHVDSYSTPTTDYTTAAVQGASSYTWTIDPETAGTINVQDNTCTVTWDGGYTGSVAINVAGTNDCGNGPASGNYEVTVENSFGIEDYLGDIGIQVYPNPSRGNFYIEFSSVSPASVDYKIINSLGEIVYAKQNIVVNGQYKEVLDLSGFSEGMYFLMISNDDQTTHKRIIIQK